MSPGRTALAAMALFFICPIGATAGAADPILTTRDAALIQEAFHLQHELGHRVWADWAPTNGPLVYKTGAYEVMIGREDPPAGFEPYWSETYGDTVRVRPSDDTQFYTAAFPFEGRWSAVLSRPPADYPPAYWVSLVVHEFFHIWQNEVNPERLINPFVGEHSKEHELSFRFPHDDDRISSLYRLEAEEVFRACTADSLEPGDARRAIRLLAHVSNIAPAVYDDSLAFVFKQWMEWNEGVSRYTEREIAALAADPANYTPTEIFAAHFPDVSYTNLWETQYAASMNPIRFIGEGVKGRTRFYYMGMGKAYLLDQILPDWKESYFRATLDDLIGETRD